jgi:opacity protein-like surface antigen
MQVRRVLREAVAGSLVVAVAAFASTGLALADGMPRGKAVVYEAPSDWSGFYFGLHSGFVWSGIDGSFVNPPPESWSLDHSVQLAGAQVGIQHQFGNVVLGVEGTLSAGYRNNAASTPCLTCAAGTQLTGRFDDVITVGPRLGWAMGKWMPYLTGGYASGAFTHQATLGGTPTSEARTRHSGWYVGAGVDMALAHGWTIGLEYRHYEFDDVSVTPHTPAGVSVPALAFNADPSSDAVTLRASWKLGRPEARPLK